MVLTVAGVAVGTIGPGEWSIDYHVNAPRSAIGMDRLWHIRWYWTGRRCRAAAHVLAPTLRSR